MACSPEPEKHESSNETDIQRITNLLLDLNAVLRRPIVSNPDLGASVALEVSKHEPYI
jgi:hypothetical protein